MLLKQVADAFAASKSRDSSGLGRLAFWVEKLGHRSIIEVTADDADVCLVQLAERGKLQAGRGRRTTERTGKPLKGSTINRYQSTLGELYKFAKKMRLVPRNFVPPTRGLERHPEPIDPDRYFRDDEVERLVVCARVVDKGVRNGDKSWRHTPAVIVLAYHTGLRTGSLKKIKWRNVDFAARRIVLGRTKNGEPIGSALTERCVEELEPLSSKDPDALVFGNRRGAPFDWGARWEATCNLAGLPKRNFHQLRHGCGTRLAQRGTTQPQIMAVMGHKTLAASVRYMHLNTDDQRAVVDKVFG